MSSPVFGYSSWGRHRSSSISSQTSHHDDQQPAASSPPNQDARHLLSSSVGSVTHREPLRSFIHSSVRGHLGTTPRPRRPSLTSPFPTPAPLDSAESARSVREDTAELATYLLSEKKDSREVPFLRRARSASQASRSGPDAAAAPARPSETIDEVSEPPSPDETAQPASAEGPSMLTTMFRRSPPDAGYFYAPKEGHGGEDGLVPEGTNDEGQSTLTRVSTAEPRPLLAPRDTVDEVSPLLGPEARDSQPGSYGVAQVNGRLLDLEGQKYLGRKTLLRSAAGSLRYTGACVAGAVQLISNPKRWDSRALWQNAVVAPVACLPAVVVGLLFNILDALSYGIILFPLGSPIFASLGSAGISMFYVSCIISQLTFSAGSIFKGGVGSELIEVVPFFHNMAATITDIVGDDKPDAVIATTITSYALSSMLTGAVFYLMGKFKFGYLVGFIPRHILIGCIGGVGWFLIATGFEVTARMDGNLGYDLDTLKHLIQPETVPLWVIPLVLAVILFYCQSRIASKYFLPSYILIIPAVFYALAAAFNELDPERLRDGGWVFEGPPAGEPWWYFYTLYKFNQVHWGAIAQCIPAMLALTFFGILHVPINVPALALNTGEDHANLDHELKLHGYSNFLSGMAGSIQNYLVYSNSLFFMRSGGNTRLAGVLLAAFTFLVMLVGPSMIGFIPVMMVGVLIFDLGFELLLEAVWQPRKKLKPLEYFTVMVIVMVMGTYDFVVGIGVGILLAFMSLTFQTSRVSAVRASYSGDVVGSTVRRNLTQQHYLRQVGRQINIIKLSGYLFFGTIVGVEDRIRALIADVEFAKRPIRFLILDLWHVTGVDYSAAEVFNTISRLLHGRRVELVVSGVDAERGLGRTLRAVGLGEDAVDVRLLPDLNSALEYCENELLKMLYVNQDDDSLPVTPTTANLDVPGGRPATATSALQSGLVCSSPRRDYLRAAARNTLGQAEMKRATRWQAFKEPLRLMLQIFRDVSECNEDFWFRAVPYFQRAELPAGTVLFRRGEKAEGFYLLEAGILRAEYDLPQGDMFESIVAGTTCGELPFFSETRRTATCVAERECVVWKLGGEEWERLQREEPEVAKELLKISLKLTSERMSVMIGHNTLTMGGQRAV
ncbi:sulfate transporter family-domain-containing protein [Staphylotrichum tortipilum]|uniref:Sulfate transporter family-domain-containing protein n=1 Tax=Staphylotrichum tortipilum TaxID=2831512 RepID=A0AAN6MJD1_9PEZI|nr:sulfate transporter family-domain-containing protein [Staphylotrichum longicolle]